MPLGHDHSTQEAPQDPSERLGSAWALVVIFLVGAIMGGIGWLLRGLVGWMTGA